MNWNVFKNYPAIFLICLLHSMEIQAQNPWCTGSTSVPVLLETFGAGSNPGAALPNGVTNYSYVGTYPMDGNYTISNTTGFLDNPGPAYWHSNPDHTGNQNGYMMVVNANATPGEFYRKQVTGLCPNSTYIFSAWAANVNTRDVHAFCDPNYIFPDILFKIEDPSGILLGSQTSGQLPIDTNGLGWKQYGFSFKTPASGQSSVNLVLVNNAPGGCGNDLVLDDISFYICQPSINPVTQPFKPAYCAGENVTIVGGLGPGYTTPQYQWQFSADGGITWNDIPGETNPNIILSNLAVLSPIGQYRLIVAENGNLGSANCRLISPPVAVNVVPLPAPNIVAVNITCFGGNNGSLNVNPTGGTPPYTYLWSAPPGGSTQTISGLIPGSYSIAVTDKNGCKATAGAVITTPNLLSLITAASNVKCFGSSDGTGTVSNVAGGTPAYAYSWNNGQTAQTATGLSPGNYSVLVTDANGCTATNSITVTQPTALSSTSAQTNIACNGGNNGSAGISVSGGTKNYSYLWNTGQTTSSITGIGAGNYSVVITDANGCTYMHAFSITQPLPFSVSLSGDHDICLGETTTLTATSSGGTPAYTHVWMPGAQSGQSISVHPTASTTYIVTTTDANMCSSATQTFSISVNPLPIALFDTISGGLYNTTFSFSDLSSGSIAWLWDFGDGITSTLQNPIHTFSGAGIYSVTQIAYNQFGCSDTFRIIVQPREGIIIPNVFTPDDDGVNDVWFIQNSGMHEFHVEIFDRWGLKLFETTSDDIRWDGRTASGKLLTEGTYYFTLKARLKSTKGIKDFSTTGTITLLTRHMK